MKADSLQRENPQQLIRILQNELTETNREVLLLTVELDKRVQERTAELCAAQEQLLRKNQELLRKTAELEDANKEMETFSYSVSHDLRAPLRHMDAYLGMLLEDQTSHVSETGQQYLRRVVHAAHQMGKLIDDLLAFSRMGRAEMRHMEFSMTELVNEVIEDMADDLENRNIEWDIQSLPVVRADRDMLKQVWTNLISNAVKYTRPRNPAKISIGSAKKDDHWKFFVRDNGVGFNPAYVDRLFGVFQRLHSVDEFEGTGIGLANVKQIILRHGGQIRAEAEPDKGATFHFTLPA